MGLIATGVVVHVRDTSADYGMHDACADDLIGQLVSAGYSPVADDMPAVIVGPLFADAAEWNCAHSGCAEVAR